MLEIRIGGVDLLDRVPYAIGDDLRGYGRLDVELLACKIDGLDLSSVLGEAVDGVYYWGVLLLQLSKISHAASPYCIAGADRSAGLSCGSRVLSDES